MDKLTVKSIERRVIKFLKTSLKSYPKLHEMVIEKKLNIKDIPIITYCAHSKCDASEKLIHSLYSCGINNVLEWKEGMEGWNKKRSFFSELESESEDKQENIDEEEKNDDDDDDSDGSDDSEGKNYDDSDGSDVSEGDDDEEEIIEDEDDELKETESSEEEDDFIEITHEGVEYFYNGDILYDNYMEPIGKVKVHKNKIIDMDEKVKEYHDKMKKDVEIESPKTDKKPESKKKFKTDEFTEGLLSDHVGGKEGLKDIIKKITSREKGSYNFGDLKNMKKK